MTMKTIRVHELPKCDFCGEPAPFDDKTTKRGQWANMCKKHQREYGFGIGTKKELIEKAPPKRTFEGIPKVLVPMELDGPFGVDSLQDVKCPWCDEPRRVEVDARYLVTCRACEQPYRLCPQI